MRALRPGHAYSEVTGLNGYRKADLCHHKAILPKVCLGRSGNSPYPDPISPAKAGAQIHPVRFGLMRHRAGLLQQASVGSIWAPAFAGEVVCCETLSRRTLRPTGVEAV